MDLYKLVETKQAVKAAQKPDEYVITRPSWETVGHVMAQGRRDALSSGFGFGSNIYSH
ncbi:hypothetical protein [Lactobacillus sp. ESL0228]|uniref:hypothetical protein n=1 Tax=Lactobacillus sp. ESL0228 TaxID=2069352 RepID=UPI001313D92A|nr:hypothetical protein [Lactobacillus sp. ESL0228]